ncbi:MAG: tRNA pseudouridine(38-40) synthase TruA, partial [Nocardioidaceae bacterium]|nr:tRNA pseudouridine(38-40) synthase TruA [Nocardioidaceae bacterium]
GQVAHVDLDVPIRPESLVRRLARYLPPDVSVRKISEAPEGFHARFSAIERRYVYRLCDTTVVPDPLQRRHIATFRHQLDVTAMNYAAQHLLGDHDFASFCKRREGATTIRTLRQLSSLRRADDVIETTVRANAFCHSMVRSLMGALVAVGEHAYEPEWAAHVLKAGVRHARVTVMPARGLTLEEVVYPSEAQLAARALEARTRRTL